MKTKNIKVLYSSRYSQSRGILHTGSGPCSTVPKIQMEGRWLEALGFTIGAPLLVEYEEGSIRIRTLTAEELEAKEQQEAQAELAWVDGDGGKWRYPLDWDARLWRSGSRVICRAQIPAGTGRLYLGLWRKWDRRRIPFANEPDRTMGGEKRWEGYVLLA